MSDARDLLRSYLRQRAELGDAELVLERWSSELRGLLSPRRPPSAPQAVERPAAARAVEPRSVDTRPAAPPSMPSRPAAEEPTVETPLHVRAGAPAPGTTPMRPAPDAPSRGVSAEEIRFLPTLDEVREVSLGCPRCRLAETRMKVVFGEGDPAADVMVVGEAPGADEDRSGRPFVGKAGKLLDLLLMTAGFPREQVYICNVLKCRPPMNRNPLPDEVEACNPYLLRQVELVKPRAILAFGTFAAQTLLATDVSIGRLRGKVHHYQGVPLIPTYHPAALLRNPGWVRAVWDDLQRLRGVLDAS
ncbi:MAG TPA: uracil-DNA glycosylase family protein [Longimicrobium sp.]|nr:uracil-DNA glycosylase family protein [Longimicrobium sp.]